MIDENWSDLYAQVEENLGGRAFSFQKKDNDGHLVLSTDILGVPINALQDNPENVTVCGEGRFCKLIGPPSMVVRLLKRIKN